MLIHILNIVRWLILLVAEQNSINAEIQSYKS